MKNWAKNIAFFRNIHARYRAGVPFNFYRKKISGAGNRVEIRAQAVWKSSVRISGSNNEVIVDGAKLIKNLEIKIRGDGNRVRIEEDCQIKRGVIWIEGDGNTCEIGRGTTIEEAGLYLTEEDTRIEIGSDCMFGDAIVFRTGDSHSILDRQTGRLLNPAGSISVGDHVWIGQGATLLKNSAVGAGSVVGTRSLVNKSFEEENIVLAGIPARKIRGDVHWIRERLTDSE